MHHAGEPQTTDDQCGADTTESLEGVNAQYAIDLGLGIPADRKPKYDPLELGKQMDDAIRRECFKDGKSVCGKGKRKAAVALSMGVGVQNKQFSAAWAHRKKNWPGGW
jgi:hypothetical protein